MAEEMFGTSGPSTLEVAIQENPPRLYLSTE
jgi:hypothetical protein